MYFKKGGEILIYTLVKINLGGYWNEHKVHSDFKPPSPYFFSWVIEWSQYFDVQESSSLFETVTWRVEYWTMKTMSIYPYFSSIDRSACL